MTDLKLTPEEQFILACLRTEFSGNGDADFPEFDYESFDWNRVYNKSLQWRIAPLLYKIIEKLIKSPLTNCPPLPALECIDRGAGAGGGVPESLLSKGLPVGQTEGQVGCSPLQNKTPNIPKHFLEKIKVEYLITCVANNAIYKDLAEISGVFNKAGIKFILLKGSHLARFVYNDIGMRPMDDIDILVKKEEMGEINKILNKLGYKAHPLYRWHLHNNYAVNYYCRNKTLLQVHWDLFVPDRFAQPIQPLPNKVLWENAKPIDKENMRAHILSNETNVLYLCLHAARHWRDGIILLKFFDIALFLQKNAHEINNTYFLELVKNSRLETLIYHILQITKEYFDIDIPLLKYIESRHESSCGDISSYFSENRVETALMRYCRVLYNIPGLWGKLYTLFHYSFPSREYLICRYGAKKTYLFTHFNRLLRRKG